MKMELILLVAPFGLLALFAVFMLSTSLYFHVTGQTEAHELERRFQEAKKRNEKSGICK